MGCIPSEPILPSSQYEVGGTTDAIPEDATVDENELDHQEYVESSKSRALKHFNLLDSDGDGGIDLEELTYFWMHMGYCQFEAKRRALDDIMQADYALDNWIDFELIWNNMYRRKLTMTEQIIHRIFDLFDTEGNGKIDPFFIADVLLPNKHETNLVTDLLIVGYLRSFVSYMVDDISRICISYHGPYHLQSNKVMNGIMRIHREAMNDSEWSNGQLMDFASFRHIMREDLEDLWSTADSVPIPLF